MNHTQDIIIHNDHAHSIIRTPETGLWAILMGKVENGEPVVTAIHGPFNTYAEAEARREEFLAVA